MLLEREPHLRKVKSYARKHMREYRTIDGPQQPRIGTSIIDSPISVRLLEIQKHNYFEFETNIYNIINTSQSNIKK